MEPKQTTPRADYEWTDAACEDVRAMWANGVNMRLIAARIGCTRNAVAGIINRLGLVKKPKPRGPSIQKPTPKMRPNMQTINARAVRMQDEPPAVPVERHIPRQYVAAKISRKKLLDLLPQDCRWPCDTSSDGDFWFCGALQVQGAPYCGQHCAVAYTVRR